jgi:hypothetical protein
MASPRGLDQRLARPKEVAMALFPTLTQQMIVAGAVRPA